MLRLCVAIATLCLFSLIPALSQAQEPPTEISFRDAPDWVTAADLPSVREERLNKIQDGVYYLISDFQVRIEDDRYVFYRRLTAKVTNRTGLEDAARLQFTFDPLDDEFAVHSVRIVRDGAVIDRLKPETFIVARQETDMANGVTDGNLTVYAEVEDVRVGDIVDYEVSWTTRSELWPGAYANDFPASWSVPLEFYRHRVLAPLGDPLTITYRDTVFKPQISEADGYREYLWQSIDPEIVTGEDAVPQAFSPWGRVSISTLAAWSEVVDSLIEDYDAKTVLPADFAANQPWFAGSGDLSQKITAAIRYVQDEIRYVADETGVGSHLPRKPRDVIARGWGDCKDKSLLLVAILRALGVEAYVALTDLDLGFALPQYAPSPYAFDHAIVVYTVNGRRYWNDPTSYAQGGVFPDIAQPIYGYGLALKPGNDALWRMNPAPPGAPEKLVQEFIDFTGFETTGVELNVNSEYIGREADSFRRTLASKSPHQLAQDYLSYYQGYYPGIAATADLAIDDDRDANKIIAVETYFLDREEYAGKPLEEAFPLRADTVLGVLTNINFNNRTTPIALPYPVDYKHEFILKGIGQYTGEPEFKLTSDYLDFQRSQKTVGSDTTLGYRLKTRAIEAPSEFADEYRKVVSDLNDFGVLEFLYGVGDDLAISDIIYLVAAAAMLAGLIYLPIGIYAQLKRDNEKMPASVFYPVSMTKFVILNIASFGLYALFWMWRCWRWVKSQDESAILPFWRAFFSGIWFYPLFAEIRGQQDGAKAPVALGIFLTIGFIAVAVGGNIAERVYEDTAGLTTFLVAVSSGLTFLFVIPLLLWVNGLNKDAPQTLADNSRWTAHTVGALLCGAVFWGLVIIGSFMPA